MNPLLLLAGKPLAGLLAGVTLFGYTVRSVEVEAHQAEAAALRAEIEALEAEHEFELEARDELLDPEEIDEVQRRLVVPEIDEVQRRLVIPEAVEDTRKQLEDARPRLRVEEIEPER